MRDRNSNFDSKTKTTPAAARRREHRRAPPSRVGRGEQGEARRAHSTANGGLNLELGRLRPKTWCKSDFSIAGTTCPTYLYVYLQGAVAGTHAPGRGDEVEGLGGWFRYTISYLRS